MWSKGSAGDKAVERTEGSRLETRLRSILKAPGRMEGKGTILRDR